MATKKKPTREQFNRLVEDTVAEFGPTDSVMMMLLMFEAVASTHSNEDFESAWLGELACSMPWLFERLYGGAS